MATTIRLVLLVTLFAALVLAAPTPTWKKRNLQKRSFKVPRSLNQRHPRGPNGPAAMRKVFLKYNFKGVENIQVPDGFIANQKNGEKAPSGLRVNAANSTTNGTGTVAAVPEQNAALFLSPVDIGGQTLNLDFDSGSSDLWMFSTDLPPEAVGGHTAFDPAKSANFKKMDGAQFSISYGDGSGAAGSVGTDTVTIGGVKVENQAVELASAVSRSFVEDTNTDGLVGLAFSNLNTVNDGTKKIPQKTFFDNVMNDLDMPVFTADLDPDGTGVYEFGKIDATKFEGDMAWIPVNASSGFWQFDSAKFSVDGQVQDNPTASKAIADTGTSLLLVDQNVAEAYYSKVQGAQLNAQVGGFIYPCDAKLPDMAVAIGDSYMAKIPGSQITFATVDEANTTCFGGVQGNMGAGLQIYGDTMFKAQLVAFNGGNQSVGFGQKPDQPNPAQPQSSGQQPQAEQPAAEGQKPAEPQAEGEKPAEPQAEGEKPAEQPAAEGEKPAEPQAEGEKPAEPQAEGEKPAEQPAAEGEKPAEPQAEGEKPAKPQAEGEKPAEQPAAEGEKPAESQTEGEKLAAKGQKPTESQAEGEKPVEGEQPK